MTVRTVSRGVQSINHFDKWVEKLMIFRKIHYGKNWTAVNIEFGNGRLRIMTSHDLEKKLDIIADLHIKQLYEKMLASFKLNQVQVRTLSFDFLGVNSWREH